MDCAVLDELLLDEWSNGLLQQLNGKRYPLIGLFELTDRCNFSCVHCYINQPANCKEVLKNELSTDQVKHILDQIAEAGCLFLTITGGEVFIRPDFLELYRYMKKLGILVIIFTNGTLITPRIADELAKYRPRLVEITMYGATRETYEKITKVPGSFDRFLRGVDLLLERNIKLSLKTVVLKENLDELSAMQAFSESRGISFRYDAVLWPRIDGSSDPYEHSISIDQIIDLDMKDPERRKEWIRIGEQFSGKSIRHENVYSCGAGINSFHIDSTGHLSICTMARKTSYDLKTMSFQDAWQQIGELRKLKRQQQNKCLTCTLGGLCFQCPAWSLAVHDDDETPVEFLCELAHKRLDIIKKGV